MNNIEMIEMTMEEYMELPQNEDKYKLSETLLIKKQELGYLSEKEEDFIMCMGSYRMNIYNDNLGYIWKITPCSREMLPKDVKRAVLRLIPVRLVSLHIQFTLCIINDNIG